MVITAHLTGESLNWFIEERHVQGNEVYKLYYFVEVNRQLSIVLCYFQQHYPSKIESYQFIVYSAKIIMKTMRYVIYTLGQRRKV